MSEAQSPAGNRSHLLLAIGHGFEMAMPLLRAVVLARLMPPEEFGLAFALSTVVSLAEMAFDAGLQPLALRHDIADRRARGTLHSIAMIRAALLGLAVVLAAPLLAHLFHRPDAAFSFLLLGPVLLIRGGYNLAVKQMGRVFDFRAEALTLIAAQAAWTIGAIAFALILGDHRGMVVGLMCYALVYAGVSNLLAGGRFAFNWERTVARDAWKFSLPFVPNGMMLAVSSLGDRLVVGARAGLGALAIYGPLVTLAILPRGVVVRYINNLFLPRMVGCVERGEALAPAAREWVSLICFTGASAALGFFAIGEPVIRIAFGAAYAPPQILVTLTALLLLCRIEIVLPVPMALAKARTWLLTLSSAIAAVSLAPATLALVLTSKLTAFLATMVAVEAIGLVVVASVTLRAFNFPWPMLAWPVGVSLALVAIATAMGHALGAESFWLRCGLALGGSLLALILLRPSFAVLLKPNR